MSTQASLSSYTAIKLRLASVLENLLAFAQAQKDENRSRYVQSLLADLADDTFRLAVFGKYNRGKSTLINALIGVNRLPTGILPLTSVVTTVRYDAQEHVLIQREGWSVPQKISLEQLPEYITENGNPGNEKRVMVAQIFLPADILRYGFFLVDTPGTGSSILANTKAAESFISRADAAIVVLSVESPLDEEELDLLERVHRQNGKAFVVLNKADLVSADEKRQIAEAFTAKLRAQMQEELPVFVLSARAAMTMREQGIEDLIASLLAFMKTEKNGQFLRRMAERAADLIQQEHFFQLLLQKASDKKSLIRGFDEFVSRASREGTEAARPLLEDSLAIEAGLRPHIAEWRTSVIERFKERQAQNEQHLVEFLRARSALKPEIASPAYVALLSKLEDLIESVRSRETELTGASYSGAEGKGPLAKFKAAELIPVNSVRPFSPPRSPFGWIPGMEQRRLPRALDAYCQEFYEQMQSLFRAQVSHLVQTFGEHLKKTRERVARILMQQNDPQRVTALQRLSHELKEIGQQITSAEDLKADSRPVHTASRKEAANKCALCQHLTEIIFQFMRGYPYRLLMDPEERIRNAERGGLCSFHTWMYESISSPQGICGGYAPVLLHMADRLESLANTSPDMPAEIQRTLRELANRSEQCIACRVIDGAYEKKVQEIAANPECLQASTLCLPHLCGALLHDGKAPANLQAIGELADRLRRMGEDMQQFALKQSGLRYGWTSSAEKAAYANGLMMVAAARPISYIKQVVEIGS